MCIISFYRNEDEFVLTHNRDEEINRSSSKEIVEQKRFDKTYFSPVDERANGTWIFYSEQYVACILNGGIEKPTLFKEKYRESRGIILLDLLKYNSVNEFIDSGVDSLNSVYKLIKKQDRMLTLASFYDEENHHALNALSLPLGYILEEINVLLDSQVEQAEPTGQVTFSQIGQLRPLPYKLIVMLNLDSGKFPNRNTHLPFDLMEILKPQLFVLVV